MDNLLILTETIHNRSCRIEAETKWPTCYWRHYQIHFLEWKLLYFDSNFTEIGSSWPNEQYTSIAQATRHHLKQWWLRSLGLGELTIAFTTFGHSYTCPEITQTIFFSLGANGERGYQMYHSWLTQKGKVDKNTYTMSEHTVHALIFWIRSNGYFQIHICFS